MDMMLLGETVQTDGDQTANYTGFWMPAGGSKGVAGVEVFLLTAASGLNVSMETKSSNDADSGATSIGNLTLSSTSAGQYTFSVTGARDLVRYRVQDTGGGTATLAHLQFAQPLWQPN